MDDSKMEILQADEDMTPPVQERTTTKYMAKYERARVLGTRALQIR